ncbi:MAG: flagellar motor switch protein FliM [Planctomycetota bacterium]
MNEILSNDEIDTLLEMFRTEGPAAGEDLDAALPPAGGAADRVVSPLDLLRPNRLAREQVRELERWFGSAGKMLSASISDRLRLDVRCDCVAVEQLRFQNWLDRLPGPVAIHVLEADALSKPALFTASTSLLYGAVDRIMGGTGKVHRVPKEFTEAEFTVADSFVRPCLDRIAESLAELVPISWSVKSRFCNPLLAQILPSQEVVISVYFQVSGESLIGDLRLVIPFSAVEALLQKHGKDRKDALAPGSMRDRLGKAVRGVPLDLAVTLGEARIRLRQLLNLEVGDVVPLETLVGQTASVPVMGKTKFKGHIGRLGNRLALRIADVVAG